jgi:SH3 domain-containing protein
VAENKPVGQGEVPPPTPEHWEAGDFGVYFRADRLPEWTLDWYASDTYSADGDNPRGPARGRKRVVRAGPYRYALDPETAGVRVGFRCVFGGGQPVAEPAAVSPPDAEPGSEALTMPPEKLSVTVVDVNLYAGPSLQAAAIGRVAAGTKVSVAGRSDNFLWVRLANGDEGFVPADAISESTGDAR